MADSNEFKSLAQFVSVNPVTWQGVDKYALKYTNPNYQDPKKEFTVTIPQDDASEELIERMTGLSIGDKFCLTTKKNADNPKFNDLVNVSPASDAPTKSKSDWKGKSSGYVRDETGVALGAAWNNAEKAIEIVGVIPGTIKEYLSLVQATAWEIYDIKEAKGVEVRNAKAAAKPKEEEKEAKPLSKLELAKLKKQEEAAKAKEPKPELKSEPTQDAQADSADLEDDIPF